MQPRNDLGSLYERDFYAWTQRAGELLRKGCFGELDIEHLAEEIEDMGKEQKRSLESQMRRLILHLLKWQFQPHRRTGSWLESIDEARSEIEALLRHNPSLKAIVAGLPEEVFNRAVKLAARESKLDTKTFPKVCPYTVDELLDDDFLPEPLLPDPRD